MKLAILQNRVSVGGRSKVIAETIKVLNERTIIPDLITLSSKDDFSAFSHNYGLTDRHNYRPVTVFPLRLTRANAYQTPFLNFVARRLLTRYDVVFNSNNCIYMLPKGPKYIHYIHFLPEASLAYNKRLNSGFRWEVYKAPLRFLYAWFGVPKQDNLLIANSVFTRDKIAEFLDVDEGEVTVISPPTFDTCNTYNTSYWSKKVLSLGSFSPNKGQLEQIRMAAKLPSFKFGIVGTIKSRGHYAACQRLIHDSQLSNVNLYPDLSRQEVSERLREASIFLHTMVNEPFGISTVEAIAQGCIPVVHDSGGQREIVPIRELRFSNVREAIEIISWLDTLHPEHRLFYVNELQNHVRQYRAHQFRRRVGLITDQILRKGTN